MSELDDRFEAVRADPSLAPSPLARIEARAAARAGRRDLVALVVCSLVALLGVGSLARGLPELSSETAVGDGPSVITGPGPTSNGSLGVRGNGEVSLSCASVGTDVLAAQSGLAFIGAPVAARVAALPTTAADGIPDGAAARVVWTFDVESVLKGAAPKRVDVTVEWLDGDGRPLTPRDPTAELAAHQNQRSGVLADRLGGAEVLVVRATCDGYTVPPEQLYGLALVETRPRLQVTEHAVALAAIEPTANDDRGVALAALDADGQAVGYGAGPAIDAIAPCEGSRLAATLDTPRDGAAPTVSLWDVTRLTVVRTEPLPRELEPVSATIACLDGAGGRIVVAQVADRTRIAVRSADGSWTVSDARELVAAAVVLTEPEVVLLASSAWGPTVTTIDVATLTTVSEASLGDTGDVVAGAAGADGTHAVFALSNGAAPAGSPATGARVVDVASDGRVLRTIDLPEGLRWEGPSWPVVFPARDGSVAIALGDPPGHDGMATVVTYGPDGTRTGEGPGVAEPIDRVLWVGEGRAWSRLGSTRLPSATDEAADRTIWPFGARAVVGLDGVVPVRTDRAVATRAFDAVDADFAEAEDLSQASTSAEAGEGPQVLVVAGVVLLAAAAIGAGVVLVRRRRRRPGGERAPADEAISIDQP